MKSKPQTPNNFQDKLEEILHLPHIREFYDWCTEENIDEDVMYKIAGWLGSEIYLPAATGIKAITTLCEEEVREARIDELDSFVGVHTGDTNPKGGSWCRDVNGEQFRACVRCLANERIKELKK